MGSVCSWHLLWSSLCHTSPAFVVLTFTPVPLPGPIMVLALAWVTSSHRSWLEHDLPHACHSLQFVMNSPARPADSSLIGSALSYAGTNGSGLLLSIIIMVMGGKSLVIGTLKLSRNFWRKMVYSLRKRNGEREKNKWRREGTGTESWWGPGLLRARIEWKPAGPGDFL